MHQAATTKRGYYKNQGHLVKRLAVPMEAGILSRIDQQHSSPNNVDLGADAHAPMAVALLRVRDGAKYPRPRILASARSARLRKHWRRWSILSPLVRFDP